MFPVHRQISAVCLLLAISLQAEEPMVGPVLPEGETPRYTLEDVLNQALAKNPAILTAQQEVEKNKGVVITAKAKLYPQLNSSGQVGYKDDDAFYQNSTSNKRLSDYWNVQFTVTENIFSAGVNRNTIAIAKLQQDSSFIKMQSTIDDTLLAVKEAYYTILLNRSQIEVDRQNIALLRAERDRQKNLFDAGQSTKFNVLRLEVNLTNEEPGLLQAENDLKDAEIKLSQMLGMSWDPVKNQAPFQIVGTMDGPLVEADLPSLLALARTHRPELRKAVNDIEVEERQIKIDRAANIPNFSLFVGSNTQQNNDSHPGFFENSTDVAGGLLGTWQIFDGFAGKGKAITSEAGLKQAKISQDSLLLSIEADVRRAHNSLAQARRTMQSQAENVKLAEQSLDLARLSAETGYGTVLDVLQATVDLAQARNNQNQAKYRYITSLAELERAVSLAAPDWKQAGNAMGLAPSLSDSQAVAAQLRQEAKR